MTSLRIGTRSSSLAIKQAQWVADRLSDCFPRLEVQIITIKTLGDEHLTVPLSRLDGKGFFTSELEEALLDNLIDIAVHSFKDLPYELSQGLEISACCEREDPRDVLVSKDNLSLEDLPSRSQVGTSSLRRVAQVLSLRPDVACVSIRGNLDTRLRKLDESSDLSGIVVAAAGMHRLGLHQRISHYLDDESFLPAAAQGVIAVEISTERDDIRSLVSRINHLPSEFEARAERCFLNAMGGGCHASVGARAVYAEGSLKLRGRVLSLDGSKMLSVQTEGTDPELVGSLAAEDALRQGAAQVMST